MKSRFRVVMLLGMFALPLVGCTTIHSHSVKTLVNLETEKIAEISKKASEYPADTNRAIEALKGANNSLNTSLKQQHEAEHIHALIFSAVRNVLDRQGAEAHAATYMIGEIYLADTAGLEQSVINQFNQDYVTLKDLAKEIADSWKAIETLQGQLQTFSQKSFLATLPADLVKASVAPLPGASDRIDQALKTSKQVNDALATALKIPILQTPGVRKADAYLNDFVDFLERVKK